MQIASLNWMGFLQQSVTCAEVFPGFAFFICEDLD